jgi:hypothetical protein
VLDFTGGRTRRRFSMSYRFSPERFGPVGIATQQLLRVRTELPLEEAVDSERGLRSLEDAGVRISLAGRPK